jgi:hypothetical protein
MPCEAGNIWSRIKSVQRDEGAAEPVEVTTRNLALECWLFRWYFALAASARGSGALAKIIVYDLAKRQG